MKRALMVGLILALVSFVGAQTTVPGGGAAAGSSTITSGTTATSGCASPGPLVSVANVVQCAKLDITDYLTADETDSAGAYIDSGLSIAVASGVTYLFECKVIATSAATTTAIQVAFNGPTTSLFSYTGVAEGGATSTVWPWGTTYDATNALPTAAPASQNYHHYFGIMTTTAAGNFVLRFRTEVAASAANLLAGSRCRVYQP